MDTTKFFDKEIEDFRSKMIKVYGDQHPYTFFVTACHDVEDIILKIEDLDAQLRESKKQEPFKNLEKMAEVDSQAVKEFHELLSKMEEAIPTPKLKEDLEEKKKECAQVFEIFDELVTICENYFELEYSDCRKRVEKQVDIQEPVLNEVENFLMEVEEFGNAELKSLRERISNWVYSRGLLMLNNADECYSQLSDKPFAMTVWFECSESLTSKEIRNAFLSDQIELSNLWKKVFNDLIVISAKLEKCRCNYNLTKFKLEREISWMSRDYKEKMPELTKIQRHLASLVDRKVALELELKNLENEMRKEKNRIVDVQNEMQKKIIRTKANNKFAQKMAIKKFQSVLFAKKEEIYIYLEDIVKGDKIIHEKILNVSWDSVDLSHLKLDDDLLKGILEDELEKEKKTLNISQTIKSGDTDEFSDAFQILKSSENFVTLLNMMADELGYMLDFSWVNYMKEKLEFTQEVKWLELFKVFKIDFIEMRKLKKHMTSFCKLNDNQDVVFGIDKAVDGFLNYAWQKRQSSSKCTLPSSECDSQETKNFWSSAEKVIPKSLLWESIENVLIQYWELLESRSRLLRNKMELVAENTQYEIWLENYYRYSTPFL